MQRILSLTHKLLMSLCLLGLVACNGTSQQTASPSATVTPEEAPATPTPVAATNGTPQACQMVESGFGPSGSVPVTAQEVVSGLEVPWGIVFLSNTDLLVSERPGRIRLVRNGQLQPQPVATVNVTATGEGGLLGMAAHPDFNNNRQFYIYYTRDRAGSPVNRVERWQLSADGIAATPDRVILDDIPAARFHNGGRLRFGPDGMLYIGTGDAREVQLSQDPNSLAGKILRLTPDGEIPNDNPTAGSPVFISGLRNTQGFDWFNETTLWVSDHGPSGDLGLRGMDQILVARPGDNLGWPEIYGCGDESGLVSAAISWVQAVPPGGAAVYRGNSIPEWQGSFIVGTLGSRHLHRFVFDEATGQQLQSHEVYFQGESPQGLGRIREVIMGPDNELYITIAGGDI
ncbi:MAG: PQQ-dependent sugar dehydrogenase [Desertifilum sp. SIO1I2]|nr:PQQ-dependent sugar dehydrogenase [Desertifilum sp. SIO1I2]